ncbi:MAG: hypothetical protein Kow0077_07900 [Anaerolineae bacterium]
MMISRGDQDRILQLISQYSPQSPPRLPLTFGDYLSLLWRIDESHEHAQREEYYRQCADALARGLQIENRSIHRMVRRISAGEIYATLPRISYQGTAWLVDAQDRRDAIGQLTDMRQHILAMGAYRDKWTLGWPGSRITNAQLRERIFAVLFTAFEGQFSHFSRLLLVIDIVLEELVLDRSHSIEISLERLQRDFGYPAPDSAVAKATFP